MSPKSTTAAVTNSPSVGPLGRLSNVLKRQWQAPRSWRKRLIMGSALSGSLLALGCALVPNSREIAWKVSDMPPQKSRIYLITGGNSGIGYECAKALAASGAEVVIASRNADKGKQAIATILEETPDARVRFEPLDLGNLASVHALVERLEKTLPRLDGLINNAAIMEPPTREISADGYEQQFAVNYLGHFALTAEMLPLLRKSESPRVVTLSSIAATQGKIQFDDLQYEQSYESMPAYAQSKLACLMFALELQKRSNAAGWGITSIASHPGVSRTGLLDHHSLLRRTLRLLMFQPAEDGAKPTLYAATAPDAKGGSYYGPTRAMETRGPLGFAAIPPAAEDSETAKRLWDISEELSGVRFPKP